VDLSLQYRRDNAVPLLLPIRSCYVTSGQLHLPYADKSKLHIWRQTQQSTSSRYR
jgi:hypothetical protein